MRFLHVSVCLFLLYLFISVQLMSDEEHIELIGQLFPDFVPILHHHSVCKTRHCSKLSHEEKERIRKERNREMFNHAWLDDDEIALSGREYWLCYIEGQGTFCLLCKEFHKVNPQNKKDEFCTVPCKRLKKSAIIVHKDSKKHQEAVEMQLMRTMSCFHKQTVVIKERENETLFSVFYLIYWLCKHSIANCNINSLLQVVDKVAPGTTCDFLHRSPASQREIIILFGDLLKDKVVKKVKASGCYSLLIDDMTDISTKEQMIAFIQCVYEGEIQTDFLFIEDIHQKGDSTSANAATLLKVVTETLAELGLTLEELVAMVTDGASVMTGPKSGLSARLKELIPLIICLHCICHRLALSCIDTLKCLKYIDQVLSYLTELWKLLEYSNQRMAVFLKVQMNLNDLSLNQSQKRKLGKRLKKAVQTRWLSSENSVKSALENYTAIIITLQELKDKNPTAAGLLVNLKKPEFLACMHVLGVVLPVLANISRAFQKSSVVFSQIPATLAKAKDDLEELTETNAATKNFKQHVQEIGDFVDINLSDKHTDYCDDLHERYTESLKDNIDNRFVDVPLLANLFTMFDITTIPDNKEDFKTHGNPEVIKVANHFFHEDDEKEKFEAEWSAFKYVLRDWQKNLTPPKHNAVEWCLKKVMITPGIDIAYPLIRHVAQVALTIPVTNAWPERGASLVKLVKTRLRSRMNNDLLNSLLHIHINGPELFTPELDTFISESVKMWQGAKQRKKLPKPRSKVVSTKPQVTSSCTQTEFAQVSAEVQTAVEDTSAAEKEEEAKKEEEELNAASVLLGLGKDDTESDEDSGWDDCFSSDDELMTTGRFG